MLLTTLDWVFVRPGHRPPELKTARPRARAAIELVDIAATVVDGHPLLPRSGFVGFALRAGFRGDLAGRLTVLGRSVPLLLDQAYAVGASSGAQ